MNLALFQVLTPALSAIVGGNRFGQLVARLSSTASGSRIRKPTKPVSGTYKNIRLPNISLSLQRMEAGCATLEVNAEISRRALCTLMIQASSSPGSSPQRTALWRWIAMSRRCCWRLFVIGRRSRKLCPDSLASSRRATASCSTPYATGAPPSAPTATGARCCARCRW
jgi:hypothetical protein